MDPSAAALTALDAATLGEDEDQEALEAQLNDWLLWLRQE